MTEKVELLGKTQEQLIDILEGMGEPAFRGKQIYRWIYTKSVSSFFEMSDLPRAFRQRIDEAASISLPMVVRQRLSSDGTRKLLLELEDKKRIESVLIPHPGDKDKYTMCVSTQVGCPLGCAFCATGFTGFQRNLKRHEIVGQILVGEREIRRKTKYNGDGRCITNLVYMGMGEPLLNYDEVMASIRLANDFHGINIGQRHITVSTAGIPEGIRRLADEGMQLTLALSLHAADDELRSRIMPVNRHFPLAQVMEAVDYYIEKTGRRVTLEYIMIKNINIGEADAANLIRLARGRLVNVNLIPVNPVEELGMSRPSDEEIFRFNQLLNDHGITSVIREERGADIEAACGQLKLKTAARKI